jgi:hypothetical protein
VVSANLVAAGVDVVGEIVLAGRAAPGETGVLEAAAKTGGEDLTGPTVPGGAARVTGNGVTGRAATVPAVSGAIFGDCSGVGLPAATFAHFASDSDRRIAAAVA